MLQRTLFSIIIIIITIIIITIITIATGTKTLLPGKPVCAAT